MFDNRIDEATRLATEWIGLGAVELRVHEDFTLRPRLSGSPGESMKTSDTHYIETVNRQRFMDFSMKNDAGKIIRRTTSYTDGQKFSVVEYDKDNSELQERVSIGTSFDNEASRGGSARPFPYCLYFVDKTPLHEALPTSVYLGASEYLGHNCHCFQFKEVLWAKTRQDLVYYVADDSFMPLRVVSYKNEESRLSQHPLWFWEALELKDVQRHTFPVKSRVVRIDRDQSTRETAIHTESVTSIRFGESYPPSTFSPRIEPHSMVFDSVAGKITIPPKNITEKTEVAIDLIRVVPPSDHSRSIAFIAVGAAICILLIAVVLRFRRT